MFFKQYFIARKQRDSWSKGCHLILLEKETEKYVTNETWQVRSPSQTDYGKLYYFSQANSHTLSPLPSICFRWSGAACSSRYGAGILIIQILWCMFTLIVAIHLPTLEKPAYYNFSFVVCSEHVFYEIFGDMGHSWKALFLSTGLLALQEVCYSQYLASILRQIWNTLWVTSEQ